MPRRAKIPLAITRTPDVCGGSARLYSTRIPIWTLASLWQQGADDAKLLSAYPYLRQIDLDHARKWWQANKAEVAADITSNSEDG